jgi:outer membrane protein assembly factor BamB
MSWPFEIAVNPKGDVIYVFSASGEYPPNGYFLTILDGRTGHILRNLTIPFFISHMEFDNLTMNILASSGNKIYSIDPENGRYISDRNTTGQIYTFYLIPNTSYMAVGLKDKIMMFDRIKGKELWESFLPSYPTIIVSSKRAILVFCPTSSMVEILDIQNGSEIGVVDLPQNVFPESASTYGSRVYFVSGSQEVFSIDIPTLGLERVFTIREMKDASILQIDTVRKIVYVAGNNTLLVYDINSLRNIGYFRSNYTISTLALNRENGEVYVGNYHYVTFLRFNTLEDEKSYLYTAMIILSATAISLLVIGLLWKRRHLL